MTPYTPGPWTVLTQGSGVSIAHIERHPEKTGGHRICRMHSGKPNIHDDARLIAAAPDLLEALREVALATLPDNPNGKPSPLTDEQRIRISKIASAAIAKARGQS